MPFSKRAASIGGLLVGLLMVPGVAGAQSVITGVVRDTTGAVLPGATIEGTSPALIEKARTVVSDSNGQYRIVDLRPGVYTVTFSLPGFTTVKRDSVELPSDFTLTLNADLRVGALEETVTVSGAAAVVDVQTTARREVINRDALDALPTGRSLHAVGQLVVGVTMSRPDVGGSAAMQQTYMSVHGLASSQNTIEVDGLNAAESLTDGSNPYYWPQAYIQEMVYQTSGVGADVTGGGVRANAVPRDGGNTFSGNVFVSGTLGSWVADNIDDALRAQGGVARTSRISLTTRSLHWAARSRRTSSGSLAMCAITGCIPAWAAPTSVPAAMGRPRRRSATSSGWTRSSSCRRTAV